MSLNNEFSDSGQFAIVGYSAIWHEKLLKQDDLLRFNYFYGSMYISDSYDFMLVLLDNIQFQINYPKFKYNEDIVKANLIKFITSKQSALEQISLYYNLVLFITVAGGWMSNNYTACGIPPGTVKTKHSISKQNLT